MKILALAVVLGSALNARAATRCTLDFTTLRSALNVRTNFIEASTPVHVDHVNKKISQSVKLRSGLYVTYEAGGCEHYTYSFKLKSPMGPIPADAKFRSASDMLADTPIVADKTLEKGTFQKALMDAALDNLSQSGAAIVLPYCGDATCTLETAGDTQTLTYTFGL